MRFKNIKNNRAGTILILALWSLGMLSVFAVYLGIGVRQKINLVSRLEKRATLHIIGESGIKKVIAVLRKLVDDKVFDTSLAKVTQRNNKEQFSDIRLGSGFYSVEYVSYENGSVKSTQNRFGVTDEESKVNLNTADVNLLMSLIRNVLNWKNEQAKKLAEAIIDWREVGESELLGFESDSYYGNLEYPYPLKNNEFETLNELLLVKGVDVQVFEKLLPFVTIYGQGKININTASIFVLEALGIPDELINKILSVRRGVDGIEATHDDIIFNSANNIAGTMRPLVKLSEEEIAFLNDLSQRRIMTELSYFYSIQSRAELFNNNSILQVACVYDVSQNAIVYWNEEYKVR